MDSEQVKRVTEVRDQRLVDVTLSVRGSQTQPGLLERYLQFLSQAETVGQLHARLLEALQKLNGLSSFQRCDMEVRQGAVLNSANVWLHFETKKWWAVSMGVDANNEGAKSIMTGTLRNLRGRCDETKMSVEYKPTTNKTGLEFSHIDRLFLPGTLEATYSLRNYAEELDLNLTESGYEGSITLRSLDGVHQVSLGRTVRTNLIAWERASAKLMQTSIPVTARNRVSYLANIDRRDDKTEPRSGFYGSVLNEFAYGSDTKYHKFEVKAKQYFPVASTLAFELSAFLGLFVPWGFSKVHVNDKYRGLYLKGFRSVGPREPAADPNLKGKYHFDGDDLGQVSQLNCEAKLHFYKTPLIHAVGLVPFLYANAIGINPLQATRPLDYLQRHLRSSLGFGLGWSMSFGKIEFSYAAKVFGKSGDYPAEFQVLFSL